MHLERAFGYWDNKRRRIPSMSSAGMESCVLFVLNKTWAWLMSKPEEEREELIRSCQRQVPAMKEKFKARAKELEQELARRQQQQQQEKAAKETKEVEKKQALIDAVGDIGGLWKTVEQMDQELTKLREESRGEGRTKRVAAIKTQINYRKRVLVQNAAERKCWIFSENGRSLSEDRLRENLIKIISSGNR